MRRNGLFGLPSHALAGLFLALAAAALQPSMAWAAEAAPKDDQGPVDVELPPMLAPMVVGNRLDSYAYITIALAPAARDKVLDIREKVPFLRDAFLRELNKGSIVKADDPKAVDEAAVKSRLTARVKQILPVGTVSEVKLEQIVITPVQPQS